MAVTGADRRGAAGTHRRSRSPATPSTSSGLRPRPRRATGARGRSAPGRARSAPARRRWCGGHTVASRTARPAVSVVDARLGRRAVRRSPRACAPTSALPRRPLRQGRRPGGASGVPVLRPSTTARRPPSTGQRSVTYGWTVRRRAGRHRRRTSVEVCSPDERSTCTHEPRSRTVCRADGVRTAAWASPTRAEKFLADPVDFGSATGAVRGEHLPRNRPRARREGSP